MRWGHHTTAVPVIRDLAAEHGLVLYDPQDDRFYYPPADPASSLVLTTFDGLEVGDPDPETVGRCLRGLAESETRLRMLGYNPMLTKFYAFMLSGLFATIAGILYVYYQQFVSPAVPQFLTSGRGVLMVIVGGVGTLTGPVVGAFIIVFVENIVSAYVARWLTVLGLIFILTIMFAPKGVVGGLSQAWNRLVVARSLEERERRLATAKTERHPGELPEKASLDAAPKEAPPIQGVKQEPTSPEQPSRARRGQ